ncbi:SurA N-terminal domain-containing protein [Candidatus Woesearchaeota archaeon]|nr:SurA N-terminal domain-containing protein [Candidatus Woesearchaeota archaeon]
MSKKKSKKQKNKSKVYVGLILGLIILVVLVYMLFNKFQETTKPAAIVNGEVITYAEIESLYNQLPPTYKGIITRNEILEQKINEKLLLQEASKSQIEATEEEVDNIINTVIIQSGMTEEEFDSRLSEQGIDRTKLKEYYRTQLIVLNLLNETALKGIDVKESEIEDYYEESEIEDSGVSLEEATEQIEAVLLAQKREAAFLDYMEELKSESTIEIFFGAETFKITDEELCEESGKPIIRLFTTSKCEQCGWIEESFASTIEPYLDEGDIIAYHWELDTGDNKLTLKKESSIPKSEVQLFKSFSPSLKVPAFNFGCKYIRLGNGHYDENDLASEVAEFGSVINKLLAE